MRSYKNTHLSVGKFLAERIGLYSPSALRRGYPYLLVTIWVRFTSQIYFVSNLDGSRQPPAAQINPPIMAGELVAERIGLEPMDQKISVTD